MPRNKLLFLLRSLLFDNITTRHATRLQDKLATVKDLYEDFNENCQKNNVVSELVKNDEMFERQMLFLSLHEEYASHIRHQDFVIHWLVLGLSHQ